MDLKEKVAIVTGASRGIGKAIALALAGEGASVVVAARSEVPRPGLPGTIHATVEQIQDLGGRALAAPCNVREEDSILSMVRQARDAFGRIDVLVNNASAPRMAAWAEFVDLTEEAWRYVMDVKVTGAFLCTQAVTKVMMRQGWGGSIVNVISVEAKISRPTDLAYATASGALYTFTTKAGRALAPHGIRVNGVSPGTTDTARNDALYGFPRSPEWAARVESIPIGRAGTPEEIGEFIAWLCSKEAEFIVGQCIDMDGGQAT